MPRGEKGQVLIPFLCILPSFIIIIIFLVEIGNLSTEKIRQQFALDAAASAEMEQYTDLLNRLAYLNGVFPQRIFRGGLGAAGPASMLYPSLVEPIEDGSLSWPIRFGGGREYANTENPPINFGILHAHLPGEGGVAIEKANQVAYNYISIYRWLGDVAASEKVVFERTTNQDHVVLRKSMFYNLFNNPANPECKDSPDECGKEPSKVFPRLDIRMHYLSGFKHCPVIVTIAGQTYTGELAGAFNFTGSGLWQLATVPPEQVQKLKEGFLVKNKWTPPPNHFGINLKDAYDPYVRVQVSSSGGKVWPDTTPRFMTRMQP